MNKIKLTVIELMNELHFAEEVLIKIGYINTVEVKAKPKNNGPNANKKKKQARLKETFHQERWQAQREMLQV